jgi:uncharacterized protein YyaL (SSP411 family)
VASWNGLAIAALADAGVLLNEPAWIEAAVEAADLLISVHLGAAGDDRLARTSRDGLAGNSAGVLDDYGSVAEGLLALYQATGNDEWLMFAGLLLDVAIQHFADDEGGFYDTADDAANNGARIAIFTSRRRSGRGPRWGSGGRGGAARCCGGS